MEEARKQNSGRQGPGTGGEVEAETVNITRGGAQSVKADNVVIRQGGAVQVKADRLEIRQGGLVIGQVQSASLTASTAQILLVGGDAQVDLSGARLLVARGDVSVKQGGAMVMAAREVKAQNCATVFLLAGRVDGTVNAIFDLSRGGAQPAVIWAAVGFLAGLALRRGRRRRR